MLLLYSSSLFAEKIKNVNMIAELETELLGIMGQGNVPGMIGAIVVDDEVVWKGALGVADLEANKPVTPDTLFRVGSISKSFVSLAALIMFERGEISLDTNIEKLLPEAGIVNPWSETDPVVMQHVLEHTAGFDNIHMRDYILSDPNITLLEGIQYNTSSRNVRWRPGTVMSYSNIGPPIGALALEKVSGDNFEHFVQREIFDVLSMKNATFFYDPAVSRSYGTDGKTEQPYVHIGVRPSGSIGMSSGDMIQLLRMFINRGAYSGGQLITQESLIRMETPTSTLAASLGLKDGYGLGNFVMQKEGFVYHGHKGAIDGFLSNYRYLPQHRLGYFFSINAPSRSAYQQIDNLIHRFVTKGLPPAPRSATADAAADYTGYYQPMAPSMELMRGIEQLIGTVKFTYQNGQLQLASLFGDKETWRPIGDGRYIRDNESLPSLVFIETDSGEVLSQGGVDSAGVNLQRISPLYALSRWGGAIAAILLMLSSCLFAPVWGLRKLSGQLPQIQYLSVRVLPLLASLTFIGAVFVFIFGIAELPRFGTISIWSVSYWLLTWLFTLFSIAALVQVWRYRDESTQMGNAVWLHSFMVSIALVLSVGFFSYYGMIGIRFWAY